MTHHTSDTATDTGVAILEALLTDEGSADPYPLFERARALGPVLPAGDDDVAEAVASAVLAAPPAVPRVEVIAGGVGSLRLSAMIDIACRTLNEFRAQHGAAPIEQPPFVPTSTWNRFFLPLADQYLSPFQHQAVQLPAMFQSCTSMSSPFEPTRTVHDPGAVLETAVRHWAARKPRPALARPNPWTLLRV